MFLALCACEASSQVSEGTCVECEKHEAVRKPSLLFCTRQSQTGREKKEMNHDDKGQVIFRERER